MKAGGSRRRPGGPASGGPRAEGLRSWSLGRGQRPEHVGWGWAVGGRHEWEPPRPLWPALCRPRRWRFQSIQDRRPREGEVSAELWGKGKFQVL